MINGVRGRARPRPPTLLQIGSSPRVTHPGSPWRADAVSARPTPAGSGSAVAEGDSAPIPAVELAGPVVPRSRLLAWGRALVAGLADLREPLLVFLLLRIALSFIAGYSVMAFVPLFEVAAPGYDRPPLDRLQEVTLGVWQRWDGQWYLKIATLGYDPHDGSYAFFPLYPALIAGLSAVGHLPQLVAGLVISNLAFFVALVYLHRLVRADFGPSVASRTLLYLAVFPAALYFLAVYTESLFLALTVAAFYYARGGRWWLAGGLGLLAGLTRSAGIVLCIPFALEFARQRGWDPGRLLDPRLLATGLPAVGVALYVLFAWVTTGDPLAMTHAQIQWERHFTWPWQALAMGWQVMVPGTETPVLPQLPGSPPRPGEFWGGFLESNGYNFLAAVLGLALAVVSLVKLPPAYSCYLVGLSLFPLFSASQVLPLFSMPRFLATAFPLFIVLALFGRRPWLHQAILILFALLLGVFTARFAAWYWVA